MPWVCGRVAHRQIDSVCTDCRGGRGAHAAVLRPSAGCRRHSSVQCFAAERGRRGGAAAVPAACCSAVQQHCLCCRQTTKSGDSFWGLCPPGGGAGGGGGRVGATCSREGAVSYRHLVRGTTGLQQPAVFYSTSTDQHLLNITCSLLTRQPFISPSPLLHSLEVDHRLVKRHNQPAKCSDEASSAVSLAF